MTRTCDAFKCTASVASGRFLCSMHWRMVPVDVQRTINARYRSCRRDFAFLSDLAYLQACVSSIKAIALAEGRVASSTTDDLSSYDRLLRVALRKASEAA